MNKTLLLPALLLLALLPAACAAPPRKTSARAMPTPAEHRVLVIENDDSAASREIGAFYAAKRHIPNANICHVHCTTDEEMDEDAFTVQVLAPVQAMLHTPALFTAVDYLVLTKGVPLRVRSSRAGSGPQFSPNGDSVDGRLMLMDAPNAPSPSRNPYFNAKVRFSHRVFGFYLATRLDGYTVADAESLVTRSLSAKRTSGTFLLDGAPERSGGSDPTKLNEGMTKAADILRGRGCKVIVDQSQTFVGRIPHLLGYYSWGSNDAHFDAALYTGNTCEPGAIAETVVSTSARTMLPTGGGQSLIADLVKTGVTGAKGYVAEPYTIAMARPEILFDRYTQGWNLAESFYGASPLLHWKDVVLGDPLCAPYSAKK